MAIEKTINFDMDGTIADLYGVENWLEYLQAGDSFFNCQIGRAHV